MIGVVGLLLATLYEIEAALWAAAYWGFGALNSPEEAILFSVLSISAPVRLDSFRNATGRRWLTGGDGRHVLFGTGTAYIFMVMQAYWALVIHPD